MSSSSSDMEIDSTPPDLKAEAELAMANLLPPKSKEKYLAAYDNFIRWKEEKKAPSFSETVFLAYFTELAKTKKPSTLWALYSMIKATTHIKQDINIKNYTNLVTWLKRQSDGFKCKKSKIFTSKDVQNFLNDAPDDTYLSTKVALICGISGACRGIELTNMTTKDIEFHDNIAIVKLCDTKTKTDRSFVIRDQFLHIVRKYYGLRPKQVNTDRFFLQWRSGKCTKQVIGRHKIASMPKDIATFLNLESPHLYTGHCFRRSSATLLADSGANVLELKRLGGWKSDKVAEGYVDDSVENKNYITKKITKNILLKSDQALPHEDIYLNPQPSTSRPPCSPKFPNNPLPPTSCPVQQVQSKSSATSTSSRSKASSNSSSRLPNHPTVLQSQPMEQSDSPPASSLQTSPQSTSHVRNQPPSASQTNISVPGKTITISIQNCPNMSNINFHIN